MATRAATPMFVGDHAVFHQDKLTRIEGIEKRIQQTTHETPVTGRMIVVQTGFYDPDKRRTHVSPIVKNHITVRWRTYNMADYQEDKELTDLFRKLEPILNKYISPCDRFFIDRMM